MTNRKNVLVLLLTLVLLAAGKPNASAQNAAEYMEKLTTQLNNFSNDLFAYMSSVAHDRNARKVENKRKELIKTCLTGKKNAEKMEPFEGDAGLRDSVASFFNITYIVLNEDFSKIVDMEEVAEQSYDLMEAYLLAQHKASERLKQVSEMTVLEQERFAERHNIKLISKPDEKARKLEKAEKVFANYNQYFLIFFKPFKQEVYLIDALNRADLNALRQNMDALNAAADQGLAKLDTTKAFQNDQSVAQACREMLKFYKEEANDKGKSFITFLVQQDNFKKAKETFDAIPESKRKQADVDKYNAAGTEYNKALAEFNKNNDYLNKKRTQLLERWNKAGPDFLNRHVPKDK